MFSCSTSSRHLDLHCVSYNFVQQLAVIETTEKLYPLFLLVWRKEGLIKNADSVFLTCFKGREGRFRTGQKNGFPPRKGQNRQTEWEGSEWEEFVRGENYYYLSLSRLAELTRKENQEKRHPGSCAEMIILSLFFLPLKFMGTKNAGKNAPSNQSFI